MKKIISILFLALLILSSCSDDENYSYNETDILGRWLSVEPLIEKMNDSTVYYNIYLKIEKEKDIYKIYEGRTMQEGSSNIFQYSSLIYEGHLDDNCFLTNKNGYNQKRKIKMSKKNKLEMLIYGYSYGENWQYLGTIEFERAK